MQSTDRTLTSVSARHEWLTVVLLALGITTVGINQVNIATAFGMIGSEFHLDFPLLVLLISWFFIGYGIVHIPGGLLVTRIGMRSGLMFSMIVLGLSCIGSGLANNYETLMASRIIGGFGAGVFTAVAPPAAVLQFSDRRGPLAGGIVIGCFSLGISLGLGLWGSISEIVGWRWALAAGGVLSIAFGLGIAGVWRTPVAGERLEGVRLTKTVISEVFANKNVWLLGIATLAGYGAFLGASQLYPAYGATRGFSPTSIAVTGFLFGISGVPGSIFGGWLQESGARIKPILITTLLLCGALYFIIPFALEKWMWPLAFGIGFLLNAGFAAVLNSPAQSSRIAPENAGTAVGLLLTIMAVGGFLMPYIFGLIVSVAGYESAWLFFGAATIFFVITFSLPVRQTSI